MHSITNHKHSHLPEGSGASSVASGLRSAESVVIDRGIDIGFRLLPYILIAGAGFYIYKKYINRFIPRKEISSYPDANISKAQAESRAGAIEQSIPFIGSPDLMTLAKQFAGLNYNGVIRLYNAFGKRTGEWLGGELDLFEWLRQQLDDEDFEYLGSLQNHSFFRALPGATINLVEIIKDPYFIDDIQDVQHEEII